jgi:hypothetical protein
MHLVGYLYEDYNDARSLEHKVRTLPVLFLVRELQKKNVVRPE